MKGYRCSGVVIRDGDKAIIMFGHAADMETNLLSLVGRKAIIPWSSLPPWVAAMHVSLSGFGFRVGTIPFSAYVSKQDESEEVSFSFCQPDTIRKSLVGAISSTSHFGRAAPLARDLWASVSRVRPEFDVIQGLRGFEDVIKGKPELARRGFFMGKTDLKLKAEIFRRKTA
jgi:hypothetical protein